MMVMTAKVDMKKILLILAAVAAALLMVILLLGDGETVQTAAPTGNDARVKFLTDFGWDVTTSPTESGRVRIPEEAGEVFERYNTLQKGQGYDLSKYAGKTVMRYVYRINNYPGATEPVYATLLISKNQVIGGDVTDTAAKGAIRGFQMPKDIPQTQPVETTAATEPTTQPTETVAPTSKSG